MEILSAATALAETQRSLLIPPGRISNEALIRQALRRAAFVLAPCTRSDLAASVTSSMVQLLTSDDLAVMVDDCIEDLIIFGDLLELRAADYDPWPGDRLVLRPAPPSFVARASGELILLGVAGDQIEPFADEMAYLVRHEGPVRVLKASEGGVSAADLRDLGLLELSERAWLRTPPSESAQAHVAVWRERLAQVPVSGAVDGLQILDTSLAPTYYRGRWVEPVTKHSGQFVARRPQRFGADIWCLVSLEQGRPRRLLDLFADGDRERPCDIAWRLQAAMDVMAGKPQGVRLADDGVMVRLEFYSPLPGWAERRLSLVGKKAKVPGSLFGYEIPGARIPEELAALADTLWVADLTAQAGGRER